jgi:hypothetical protein
MMIETSEKMSLEARGSRTALGKRGLEAGEHVFYTGRASPLCHAVKAFVDPYRL